MAAFLYEFEWDPVKAQANASKHGLDFERATTVFLDPLALTIPDDEHSETEIRWITLGSAGLRWERMRVANTRSSSTFSSGCQMNGETTPTDFCKKTNAGRNPGLRGKHMKPEYGFSKGERGKFFRPEAELRLPIYLSADVQNYLTPNARPRRVYRLARW